jgi:hypothetical protein
MLQAEPGEFIVVGAQDVIVIARGHRRSPGLDRMRPKDDTLDRLSDLAVSGHGFSFEQRQGHW